MSVYRTIPPYPRTDAGVFNGTGLFRRLFERILFQCMEKGLVDGRTVLTDSTHVKANASAKKNIKVLAHKETNHYMERLDFYEERERQRLEQSGAIRPKRKSRAPKEKTPDRENRQPDRYGSRNAQKARKTDGAALSEPPKRGSCPWDRCRRGGNWGKCK